MRSALVALYLCALAVPASAQEAPAAPLLDVGARIRVWTVVPDDHNVRGRLLAVTPHALELTDGSAAAPRTLELASLNRIELSRGRNRLLWTTGGVLLGAVAGVAYTRATREDDPSDIGGLGGTADGLNNTLIASLAGGLVGFFVAPERWRTVWQRD